MTGHLLSTLGLDFIGYFVQFDGVCAEGGGGTVGTYPLTTNISSA